MITSGFSGVLAAARSGDVDAFGELWRAANPSLVRYLRVVAPARADALVAPTWSNAVRELARFRGDEVRWRMLVLAAARRAARRPRSATAHDPRRVAPETARLPDVVAQTALDVLAALPAPEGEVLVLRTACGLPVAETAEITRLSPAGVEATAHRALARAGVVVGSPELWRRVDRVASPTEPVDWVALAALPDPRVAETVFDHLLAGGSVPSGAPRRWHELADLVAALSAPPTAGELAGAEAALVVFRRRFVAGPRHARVPIRLGSRVAVGLAAAAVVLPGALTAAYAGALPGWLQTVAHDWLDAPDRPAHDGPRTPASGAVPPNRSTDSTGGQQGSEQPRPTSVAHHPAAPGSTMTPPGSTKTPPGSTRTPGSVTSPAGPSPTPTPTPTSPTSTRPGSTKTPPGSTKTPPGSTKTPPTGAPTTPTEGAGGGTRPSRPAQSR
jgi:RNA polymerase sigma-70 factor (ECF subfamily)